MFSYILKEVESAKKLIDIFNRRDSLLSELKVTEGLKFDQSELKGTEGLKFDQLFFILMIDKVL